MPRIRTIKPQHCSDKDLPSLSLQAHLLWVLSWCFSDDEGVIENDPLFIKSQIFPRRTDIRIEQIEQWIDQLIQARYVIPFQYEKVGYLLHRTFNVHQKIDRPQPSKIPSELIRRLLDEHSTSIQPCIVEDSIVKERKRKPPPARDDKKSDFITETFKPEFVPIWVKWKEYKQKEFGFKYKSEDSESAAFAELVKLSKKNEDQAILIINQSMANGWKGFFELKTDSAKQKQSEGPPQKKSKLPKLANDLNYLYAVFLDGKTDISIMDEEHYEFLKKSGVQLDDNQIKAAKEAAKKYAEQQQYKNMDDNSWKSLQRKFGIIEHFKLLKSQGHVTVFRME